MSIAPEVLAEQVMSYVVWASEMIPTLKPASKKTYNTAIIPQWPHFYTWLLQAAGYLLLNKQKHNLIIISQQSANPKKILVDDNNYEDIFGKIWKIAKNKIQDIAHQLWWIFDNTYKEVLYEKIAFQFPFLRVIMDVDTVIHISLGEDVSLTQTKKLISWMKNHGEEYNIVFLTNIELPPSIMHNKKIDEHKQIMQGIKNTSLASSLLTVFQKTLQLQKRKPDIIAYVNPKKTSKNWISTRYVCVVW